MPDKSVVHRDVVQPNPGIVGDHGGDVRLLVCVTDRRQDGSFCLAGCHCIRLSCCLRCLGVEARAAGHGEVRVRARIFRNACCRGRGCGCGGGCGGGCSTRICCCHAACIVQLFAAANVIPLSVLVGLLLHTVDIGISGTDGVSSSKPIGVREAGTILPDKGFVHCNVVQADPCIRAHHAGDQIIFG